MTEASDSALGNSQYSLVENGLVEECKMIHRYDM